MADISVQERRKSDLTWVWMLLAVLVVGGFLAWLALTAEPTQVAVVEEETEEDGAAAGAALVTLEQFGANPEQYVGQTIQIQGVQVASRLGEQAFWTQLPNETPYLIKLDSALVQGGTAVQSGQAYTIVGSVYTMSDSVLTAWEQAGALQDEVQRAEAEFATSFLQATQARPARAAAGGGAQ